MFPAELYLRIFDHTLLALVIISCVVYGQGRDRLSLMKGYNSTMIWVVGLSMSVFLGTRPISGAFVDMPSYAAAFSSAQVGGEPHYPDIGFNLLVDIAASYTSAENFFLVCAALYILPVAFGTARIHGDWAFPAFLFFLSSFSFFSYGVNGIRNGLASSILIAAFSFRDRKLVFLLLAAIAVSVHKSAAVPACAFILTFLINHHGPYLTAWIVSFVSAVFYGESMTAYLGSIGIDGEDERLAAYVNSAGMTSEKGGFRWDFILYSSVPVLVSYVFSDPTKRRDPFFRSLINTYLLTNTFWIWLIYAGFSNRFAYLSWFMLPWTIAYPFIPRNQRGGRTFANVDAEPQYGLLTAALFIHFMFTFIMWEFVYSNRYSL